MLERRSALETTERSRPIHFSSGRQSAPVDTRGDCVRSTREINVATDGGMTERLRVLPADDDEAVRAALGSLLRAFAEAASADRFDSGHSTRADGPQA